MEALNAVPVPAFELSYNGRSITQDIAPYVMSATYTDHLTGEADSLDIELEDTDGRWLDRWYPEKGASLAYRFGYEDAPLISAGRFDVDELELGGPPSTVRIKGLATGVQNAVRTRKGRAYEKTTLAAIAQRIAKRHKMKLIGKVERAGYALVPLDLHYTKGRIKISVGLAKGKKQFDKRETEKKRDWNREKARLMRDKG